LLLARCISVHRETAEGCCSERVVGDLDTSNVVVSGWECRPRNRQWSLWWLSVIADAALLRARFGCLQTGWQRFCGRAIPRQASVARSRYSLCSSAAGCLPGPRLLWIASRTSKQLAVLHSRGSKSACSFFRLVT